ncbi:MAG: phosphate-binding protein [Desulfobacterales bacterium CG23_combo_of_CG06-09_8_20_14_all_52_9]|nr:MAG: phosphate-binding protein [Desulfobacterales bacterium CG23_combo_of_CG06-09_8_20_14_all_52_9]
MRHHKNTIRTLQAVISVAVLFCLFLAGCSEKSKEPGRSSAGRFVIQNAGSDTMVNVAQAWAEEYAKLEPSVSVEVSGGGSGTGIAALINGTVDIANCSRRMKQEEIDRARQNTGKEPKEFVVGHDALAIYVHKDNPLNEITLEQLAKIYGEGGKIEKWSQLGIANPKCENDEIIRISRQSNSGTYHYFRNALLGDQGDFKLGSRDLHGSKDVVELVERTPCALGYSGMGYATERVKKLKVAKKAGDPAYEPIVETTINGTYPIARPLLMYSLGEPAGEVKKYLDWIYSETGQKIVGETGYVPLPKPQGSTGK